MNVECYEAAEVNNLHPLFRSAEQFTNQVLLTKNNMTGINYFDPISFTDPSFSRVHFTR